MHDGTDATPARDVGLDGLRAFALLSVLAYHDERLHGGFLGVSVFFTLSGFLIARLLLRERDEHERVSMGRFYARRARRLLPAAFAGIALAAVATLLVGKADASASFGGDAVAALANVANWHFVVVGRSYAAQFHQPSALLHFWSLAVEEQFYIVLTPLIVALFVVGLRRVGLAVIASTLAVAAFLVGLVVAHDRAYYGTDVRALEFLVGVVLATVYTRPLRRQAARAMSVAGFLALGALAAATVFARVDSAALFRGELALHAVLVAVVIVAACEPGPLRALLSARVLVLIGLVSYGAYVYHWPVFLVLTPDRTGLSSAVVTVLRFAMTFALAAVSYVALEQPIRTGRLVTGRRRFVVAPAAVAGVVVAVVAVTGTANAPTVVFAPVQATTSHVSHVRVHARTTGTTGRHRPVAGSRVMIVGDSVALTVGRGIERWGSAHDVGVTNAGALGCTLLYDVTVRDYAGVEYRGFDPCRTEQLQARYAAERPDLVIVLFGAWDVYDAVADGHNWSSPGDPVWNAHYATALERFSTELAASKARVLWMLPPCFALGPNGVPGPWYDPARVVALRSIYRANAKHFGFAVTSRIATAGCPVDMTARPDGVHYTDPAADAAVALLVPDIVAALAWR